MQQNLKTRSRHQNGSNCSGRGGYTKRWCRDGSRSTPNRISIGCRLYICSSEFGQIRRLASLSSCPTPPSRKEAQGLDSASVTFLEGSASPCVRSSPPSMLAMPGEACSEQQHLSGPPTRANNPFARSPAHLDAVPRELPVYYAQAKCRQHCTESRAVAYAPASRRLSHLPRRLPTRRGGVGSVRPRNPPLCQRSGYPVLSAAGARWTAPVRPARRCPR